MRLLSGNKIHNGYTFLPEGSVLILNDDGEVLDIKSSQEIDKASVEHHHGILCPGLINTHCHLELSYMKGKIAEGKGLHEFIKEVEQLKKVPGEEIQQAIVDAGNEMYSGGIVAVGDICNNNSTFKFKSDSTVYYHNFLEVFAFDPNKAGQAFGRGRVLFDELKLIYGEKAQERCSITPHAPYSASAELLNLIADFSSENNSILSMHMQENEDENLLFTKKAGKILDRLHCFGIDTSKWNATGKKSLESALVHLPRDLKILLVHNTFSEQNDVDFAQEYNKNIYWCLCPNANLYIENRLPDVDLFVNNECIMTLGTDSYASNHSLSVTDEINILLKKFSWLKPETVINWATINGARFLGVENTYGSFEKGKRPGVVLMEEKRGALHSKRIL